MPDAPSLPASIADYFAAHDRHDVDVALARFTADAVVHDDGATHRGADEIRTWLGRAASEYTYTRTPLGAEPEAGGAWLVRNRLDGNFPGGTVDLAYRFVLDGDRIASLVIAP